VIVDENDMRYGSYDTKEAAEADIPLWNEYYSSP